MDFAMTMAALGKLGEPVARMRAVAAPIQRLRSLCHELKVPVIFTRLGFADDYSDSGLLFADPPLSAVKDWQGFVRGTWDFDVLDELKPDPNIDMVVDKTRNSAFYRTNLGVLLEEKGVNQLIVVGVGSNVCVESTVRDAFSADYRTVTVSDASETRTDEEHNASMHNMKFFGATATVEEVEKALKAMRR